MPYFLIGTPREIIYRTTADDVVQDLLIKKEAKVLTIPVVPDEIKAWGVDGRLKIILNIAAYNTLHYETEINIRNQTDSVVVKIERRPALSPGGHAHYEWFSSWRPQYFAVVGINPNTPASWYRPRFNLQIRIEYNSPNPEWCRQARLIYPMEDECTSLQQASERT